MKNTKYTLGLIALSAALAMPMAYAQSQTEEAAQPQTEQPTPTESATPTDSAQGAATQPTEQATGAASSGGKQGWKDVDTDKDGAISKTEASSKAGLSQIFDKADADTDGKLTPDEYKAFVSQNYGEPESKK